MVALALYMGKGRWEGNKEREGEGDVRGIDPGGRGLYYNIIYIVYSLPLIENEMNNCNNNNSSDSVKSA